MNWPDLVPEPLGSLKILRLEFRMEAQTRARLPAFLGSTIRGGLAMSHRRMMCTTGLSRCDGCPVQSSCPYPQFFETPQATGDQAIQRMRDIPHPILIEPPAASAAIYQPGDRLSFRLVFLGSAIPRFPDLIYAVREMGKVGLGVDRAPFLLMEVCNEAGQTIYRSTEDKLESGVSGKLLRDEICRIEVPGTVNLTLETPLRLRVEGEIQKTGGFNLEEFFKAACRRLWGILVCHGEVSPDDLDFRPLLNAGQYPRIIQSNLRWNKLARYSNRQQSKIRLDGLIGDLCLEGNLDLWLPVLAAIQEIHVGKSAVMGLGKVRLEANANSLCNSSKILHRNPAG